MFGNLILCKFESGIFLQTQIALKHKPHDLSYFTQTHRLHTQIVTLKNTAAVVVDKATISSIFNVDSCVELLKKGRVVMLSSSVLYPVVSAVEAVDVVILIKEIFGGSFRERKVMFLGFLVTGTVVLGLEVMNLLGLSVEVAVDEVAVTSGDEKLEAAVNICVRNDDLLFI